MLPDAKQSVWKGQRGKQGLSVLWSQPSVREWEQNILIAVTTSIPNNFSVVRFFFRGYRSQCGNCECCWTWLQAALRISLNNTKNLINIALTGLYMTKDLLARMRVYTEKFHSVRDTERLFQKEINRSESQIKP